MKFDLEKFRTGKKSHIIKTVDMHTGGEPLRIITFRFSNITISIPPGQT